MTPASQAQIVYTFDNADRLTNIVQGTQTVTIGYDNANRRTSLTLPNGVVTSYGYDNANELTTLTYKNSAGTTLASTTYGYDAAGQRISRTGGFGTEILPTPSTGTNTFNLANQQTVWNGHTVGYDLNGDPASKASTSPATAYTFDVRHRLTQIQQGASTIASFHYDTFGRRTQKTIGTTTTNFLYDARNTVQETMGTTTNTILTGLGIDERYARNESAGTRYFLADALGSTVALTDSSQAVQATYSYEPFGEVTATGTSDNSYQYTGRENDGTGLYYYRARYYSPMLKRFMSEDPMGLAAGLNEYGYVLGDPVNLNDPEGLESPRAFCGVPGMGSWNGCDTTPPPRPHRPYMCLSEKYLRNTTSLEEAWQHAYDEKTHPLKGFNEYDQTAAEHYLWARLQTQQSIVLGAAMPTASLVYTGSKKVGFFPNAGKPSWDEADSGLWGFMDQITNYSGCDCQ
jgi:RHS repeat-associated protein